MSNTEKKDKSTSTSSWWFVALIASCIIIWFFGLWGTHEYVNSQYAAYNPEDILTNPGAFGDSSGAINALFSALAFAGVIFAIILQKKELQLQREELKQTREELEGQKHEFEQQNETLTKQRFENIFFSMLSLQQEIINGIYYTGLVCYKATKKKEEKLQGRHVFYYLYKYACINERGAAVGMQMILKEEDIDVYSNLRITGTFDHYFRHLHSIIKFIDETPLLSDIYGDKYLYISILKAQLSRYELIWLFYNGVSDRRKKDLKLLLEKYAILEELQNDLLAKPEHKDLYAESAYKKDVAKIS